MVAQPALATTSPRAYRSSFSSAASRAWYSAPFTNCSRQIEANAVTTAASAFLLAMVSAVLFVFQPSASNPTHTASTAPATAPHEKGFQPAGNSGNLNSTAHPPCRSAAPAAHAGGSCAYFEGVCTTKPK